eukprot:NODE_1041_length_1818_cov_2.579407.p2 type:complete len:162 gc:universal NODE_1041_length_1818_cov_2.579407:1363-878(-)
MPYPGVVGQFHWMPFQVLQSIFLAVVHVPYFIEESTLAIIERRIPKQISVKMLLKGLFVFMSKTVHCLVNNLQTQKSYNLYKLISSALRSKAHQWPSMSSIYITKSTSSSSKSDDNLVEQTWRFQWIKTETDAQSTRPSRSAWCFHVFPKKDKIICASPLK